MIAVISVRLGTRNALPKLVCHGNLPRIIIRSPATETRCEVCIIRRRPMPRVNWFGAGVDGSGTVTSIGASVQDLSVGDRVYMYRSFTDIGTWGQEVCVPTNLGWVVFHERHLKILQFVSFLFVTARW